MPTATNIHGTASPGLHGQALSHATTLPGTVRHSFRLPLQVMPNAAKQPRFPGSRPPFAAALALRGQAAKTSTHTSTNSPKKTNMPSKFAPVFL